MDIQKVISNQIEDLLQKNPQGLNISEIVRAIHITRNAAGPYLEHLAESGQIEVRLIGRSKIYMLSRRVPLSPVLSISSDFVILLDYFLRIIFANEPFLNLIGTTSKKMTGKNIEDTPVARVFGESFARFIEKLNDGIEGKEWSGELELSTKNMILFCRIVPIVFDDGGWGVSVILEDITERKLAERAMRESEATARTLINAPTDSVILVDAQGIILELNETAARRFKKKREDVIGEKLDDILPENVVRSRQPMMTRILETKNMVRFEDERDGMWFDIVAYPVIVDTGEVKRVAIIARDITEKKMAEAALRESEQTYRRLLERTFDAIAIHKEGKIVFLNERASRILGAAKPEDLTGRSIFEYIHPDSREDLQDRLKDLGTASGLSVPIMTEKFFRMDGTVVTVEVVATRFDDSGVPTVRVAFREISSP
ncbi:MAG TPA: PAS domain S-box protein [Methanoregula sp.]|nr:PAS domain S-box protein [Methanoregula sp.]